MVYLGKSVEKVMHIGAKPELFKRAQEMRKNPTETEEILWSCLRKFRNEGYIFRRQHPINIFIADFYCHKLKLVVEVDGEVHLDDQAKDYDDGRTAELEKYGIKVIRFTNEQVIKNQENVINKIRVTIFEIAANLKASPQPLSRGRGA